MLPRYKIIVVDETQDHIPDSEEADSSDCLNAINLSDYLAGIAEALHIDSSFYPVRDAIYIAMEATLRQLRSCPRCDAC